MSCEQPIQQQLIESDAGGLFDVFKRSIEGGQRASSRRSGRQSQVDCGGVSISSWSKLDNFHDGERQGWPARDAADWERVRNCS
jgi:hypothetical protein